MLGFECVFEADGFQVSGFAYWAVHSRSPVASPTAYTHPEVHKQTIIMGGFVQGKAEGIGWFSWGFVVVLEYEVDRDLHVFSSACSDAECGFVN